MNSTVLANGIVGGSYEYRSRGVSVQRSVNLYPENIGNDSGKTTSTLVYTPGSNIFTTVGSSSASYCRGMYYSSTGPNSESKLYVIYGTRIYRVNADGSSVDIGADIANNGPVGIADNGFDILFADGVSLYRADLLADDTTIPSTFRQVNLPYLTGTTNTPIAPSQVVFLAQRFIINSQRNEFYFSQLASTNFADGATEGAGIANFYSAESNADAIRSMIVNNNRLWLFGDRSYEVWAAGGTSDNDPFTFMGGSANQIGAQSSRSVAAINDKVFWLGSSDAGRNAVFMGNGLNVPQQVSTNALEHQIGNFSDASAAVGWCMTVEGHIFYVLTFIGDKRTFVYDASTNLWHERATHNWNTGIDEEWEPLYGVTAYNKVYHGSASTNRILELNPNRYLDADDLPIVRRRFCPIYHSDINPITIRELIIDMEVGTTPLLSGLGRNPQAMLRVSRDGGNTWIDFDWRSIGSQGEYLQTVKWQNLGFGRSFTVELSFSDPSPIVIYQGRMTIKSGARR